MASESVLEVSLRRHVIDTERPFSTVLDGIFGGISRPDIDALFRDLDAAGSYEQFAALVEQAQGSAGLMRFIEEMPGGRTRIAYDTVAGAIARYHDPAASQIAEDLDHEVLGLLQQVAGLPG